MRRNTIAAITSVKMGKSMLKTLAAKTSPAAERFPAFLHSAKGAAALRDAGVLPSTE
jgi:hypothetical protein